MNSRELQAERVRCGRSRRDMAKELGMSYDLYLKKEKGMVRFSTQDIITISVYLMLSEDKINLIFFDSKLPIGKHRITKKSAEEMRGA